MTNYNSDALKVLPEFLVRQKVTIGNFVELAGEQLSSTPPGFMGWFLYVPSEGFFRTALLFNESYDSRETVFKILKMDDAADIVVGQRYFFGRWQHGALQLILDRDLRFKKKYFKAVDAWSYAGDGGRVILPPEKLPPSDAKEAHLIPGGWDHEHCVLCNSHISQHYVPFGFVEKKSKHGEEQWVCFECYEKNIVPHSLV